MQKFTLGFIFNQTLNSVLLIHKNRPEWQKGLINGIGGKVEEGESVLACIVREAREETGLDSEERDWVQYVQLHGKDWEIEGFCMKYAGDMAHARKAEDQKIEWFHVDALPANVISNLKWLIPAAKEQLQKRSIQSMVVEYEILENK
jgi:8-oxo-dGTP diphosphatase